MGLHFLINRLLHTNHNWSTRFSNKGAINNYYANS